VQQRIDDHDPFFRMISERWSASLRNAYRALPVPPWLNGEHAAAVAAPAKRAVRKKTKKD
jgi:predicted proteasome-type protease